MIRRHRIADEFVPEKGVAILLVSVIYGPCREKYKCGSRGGGGGSGSPDPPGKSQKYRVF